MEIFFDNLMSNDSLPFVTAFALGLMTAISPCPLATNITAIGFISKDISNRNKVFINGLVYTLGRAVTYMLIALIIYIGLDQMKVSGLFQSYGEKFIGPVLVMIGLVMLDVIKLRFPGYSGFSKQMEKKGIQNYWDVLLLGILFALAFCPYSGVLYFGMLIPMTVTSASGLYLPLIFALATGIPVIVISWLIAYAISGIGDFYNKMKIFEKWFRKLISFVFIGVGIYYIVVVYLVK